MVYLDEMLKMLSIAGDAGVATFQEIRKHVRFPDSKKIRCSAGGSHFGPSRTETNFVIRGEVGLNYH